MTDEIHSKFLNNLLKIIAIDGRVIIGKLKCVDNLGNLFLTETVEVFDKKGDYYTNFSLYSNNQDHFFAFESNDNQYQVYSPCIVPKSQIKNILTLNDN
jgi:small nuclear ribonucleoprotein (snRNP)-like protein